MNIHEMAYIHGMIYGYLDEVLLGMEQRVSFSCNFDQKDVLLEYRTASETFWCPRASSNLDLSLGIAGHFVNVLSVSLRSADVFLGDTSSKFVAEHCLAECYQPLDLCLLERLSFEDGRTFPRLMERMIKSYGHFEG